MKNKRFFLAVALASLPLSARADVVDDYLQAAMARQDIPGLAIAVTREGRLLRAQGYGFANLEHKVPVHADTLFKSGAIGMQLTAAAVMLLVEDGKIRLDDSIRTYLPEVPESWQPVTIRHLLNHISGIPATPNGDFRTDYSDEQLLAIITKQDLNFAAGSRWRFSYADYIVLGFMIKRVSGEYYADFLSRRVFVPLGMRTARAIDELAVIPNRAAGYERREKGLQNAEWISSTANSTADGSLYLSPLDYAAWAEGMASGRILRPSSWAEIAKPARIAAGCAVPYGFGWHQEKAGARGAWWHAGSWQGFQTFAIRYLDDNLTVTVFANSDDADADAIARGVAGLIEPKLARKPAAAIEERDPQMKQRIERLLGDIVQDRTRHADFVDFAKLDYDELTAMQRQSLSALGALQDVALFDRAAACGETRYRYRARFEKGIVETRIAIAADGRIGDLEIVPVGAWDAPL
ncbi:serine hydrolase domain-containing protein [Sphingobium cloacae]|uniref:Beta-lactamase class C n=1 Tax=Sphingobium cloacae TaxID=120107 RepID=A0A1E1EYM9_9SPHN|nr:serine hydrolase domain-containing protein [Sphingobium cloacae]BAV63360.1 beta-lactamase class C [Sphingobium cloacae]